VPVKSGLEKQSNKEYSKISTIKVEVYFGTSVSHNPGPVVNAAQGIAMQVNAAVYGFVNNFLMAVNPQIKQRIQQNKYNKG